MFYVILAVEKDENGDILGDAIIPVAVASTSMRAKLIADAYTDAIEVDTIVRDTRTGDIVYCCDAEK